MSVDQWNPAQYGQFKAERAQPFFDLLALLDPTALPNERAVDLGCGTGELTSSLHRWLREPLGEAASTLGIDSSAAMLAEAAQYRQPGLRFEPGDIADFVEAQEGRKAFGLVFSNAALQWLPDHASLFPRLLSCVAPGGQFAAQMPGNQDHPAYRIAAEIAAEPAFKEALAGHERRSPVLPPEEYALMLARAGCSEQKVLLMVYLHRLANREGLLEWVKGSMLTDYEKRLSAAGFAQFLEQYRRRLGEAVADERPCLFTFKRILMWARLPGA